MRFHSELENAFLAARDASLAKSDTGIAALSWCLWLTQLLSFALARQPRMCLKAALLLALNFVPLAEGHGWQACRSRVRCLTLLKLCLFALLCWEVDRRDLGTASGSRGGAGGSAGSNPASGICPMPGTSAAVGDGSSFSGALKHSRASEDTPVRSSAAQQCSGGTREQPAGVSEAASGMEGGGSGGLAGSTLAALLSESKLFALMHSGLAFRYGRWQHTAALQTALLAAAVAQTASRGACLAPELALPVMRQLAGLLSNAHWLPFQSPLPDPGSFAASPETSHSKSAKGASGGGSASAASAPASAQGSRGDDKSAVSGRGSADSSGGSETSAALPAQFRLPEGLHTCRLLLTWLQVCLGWMLPIWLGVLGESCARAHFASQHTALLLPAEKELAAVAAVGYEWLALLHQFPMLCLIAWHLLVVAAAAGSKWSSGGGGA